MPQAHLAARLGYGSTISPIGMACVLNSHTDTSRGLILAAKPKTNAGGGGGQKKPHSAGRAAPVPPAL
jgi:hypothetical protein